MQPKLALAGALLATIASAGEAKAQARVEVGILTCWARGSTGHLVTSTKYLRCRFQRLARGEKFFAGPLPHSAFAMSRSINFWILPVLVFGISANTMRLGHL